MSGFEPLSASYLENPYPSYAWLRDHAPVHYAEKQGWWVVSRYHDVLSVLHDHKTFIASKGVGPEIEESPILGQMLDNDPPIHTRLRGLVNRRFTPRGVAGLEPRIRQVVNQLIDDAVERGSFDVVTDFSGLLPVFVITDLFGFEQARWREVKGWSDHLVVSLAEQPGQADRSAWAQEALHGYTLDLIAKREREPRDDILSELIAARDQRGEITTEEILGMALMLVVAGHETTTHLIANAAVALIQHPAQEAKLRANPALIPSMVEEVMRWDGPVQGLFRTTAVEAEINGTRIPANQKVLVLYGAANRDERQFPDPDRFDIERSPNRQVGFGIGIHFCLGAPLARLETKIAFEELMRRFPVVQSDPSSPPVRHRNPILRGFDSLSLRLD
jgi:hypothetical protein